jgi:hypothetical protein
MNAMLPINSIPLESLLSEHVKPDALMTADTRALKAGDVMLAYPVGNSRQLTDNRSYIAKALSLGAALVLYEPSGLTEELKTEVNTAIDELKKAKDAAVKDDIVAKTTALMEKSMKLGEILYKQNQEKEAANSSKEADNKQEDIVDQLSNKSINETFLFNTNT